MARTNSTQNSDHLEIWQWNCRTFHKRAAALQNYIHSALIPPDVICLQEVGNRPVKLQGYYTLYDPKYPRVAALVSNFMTVAAVAAAAAVVVAAAVAAVGAAADAAVC